ncbi:MAG: tryptophan halogenase [Planctomycetaceae bacterium]|nr:tryptophan halogenase [Planctomycetaceae bacterium]
MREQDRARRYKTTQPRRHKRITLMADENPNSPYRKVGIVGGGTAGYLTALALKKQIPHLEVTVVESESIPVIGVGEATTPLIVMFLHQGLGLDAAEFYRVVQPTWKLGIKFEWGLPGDYAFHYPFDRNDSWNAIQQTGDIRNGCLTSVFMKNDKSHMLRSAGGSKLTPIHNKTNYAYHLENECFIGYLRSKLKDAGVEMRLGTIQEVKLNEAGTAIDHLFSPELGNLSFDLYVDCSGFRSVLLEKAMGSKFISYADSLYTDSAWTVTRPNNGQPKPYTTAVTMDHGWTWIIPVRTEDHLGYVYSSGFCDDESALAEMKRKYPDAIDPKLVKFRVGRHEQAFVGNVMSVGNSFGFVEPLESTGIHMIISTILEFVRNFPKSDNDVTSRQTINTTTNATWDNIRWFLGVHFRFNKRFETEFWKTCREKVDISGFETIRQLFYEKGPFLENGIDENPDYRHLGRYTIFPWNAFDLFMLGQGELPHEVATKIPAKTRGDLANKAVVWDQIQLRALPQNEALAAIDTWPSLVGSRN